MRSAPRMRRSSSSLAHSAACIRSWFAPQRRRPRTLCMAARPAPARRLGIPYGIDFEDLHSAETLGGDAVTIDTLAARIEHAVSSRAAFVTASSDAIGAAYRDRYGVEAATIHNAFALPAAAPSFERPDRSRLRVYWFSQTIGIGRGLEEAIEALGRAGIPAELTLRGRPQPGYLEQLTALAAQQPSPVAIVALPPGD